MSKQEIRVSPKSYEGSLTTPLRYLSSLEAGWEGLLAEAFHEPMELESWMTPARLGISLILFTGGPLAMAQRQINGPWKNLHIREGELTELF